MVVLKLNNGEDKQRKACCTWWGPGCSTFCSVSRRAGGSLGWMYHTNLITCRITFSRLMFVKKNSSNTTVQKSSVAKSSAMGIKAATWCRGEYLHLNAQMQHRKLKLNSCSKILSWEKVKRLSMLEATWYKNIYFDAYFMVFLHGEQCYDCHWFFLYTSWLNGKNIFKHTHSPS